MLASLPALSNANVVPIFQARNHLGEGAFWDMTAKRLLWVDILERQLFIQLGDGYRCLELPVMPSAIWKVVNGTVYLATDEGIGTVELATGAYRTIVRVEADRPETRSNDGGAAPDGSFWFGTMLREPTEKGGAIYRVAPDLSVFAVDGPVGIPNTFLFPPVGAYALIGDSMDRCIYRYDLGSGDPRRVEAWLTKSKDSIGVPDGSVLVDGIAVVNAEWDGGRVVAYDLVGREYDALQLPVSRPTSCALGGVDGRTLFITSARQGLADDELRTQSQAGSVFSVYLLPQGVLDA